MARIVSTGATLASPEFRNKKRKEKQRKYIIWSSVVTVTLVALVFVSRLESLLIKEVGVTGAHVITEEEVSRNVLETLSGHYLWLIPRANAALYPRSRVKENLMKEFPRFSSVALSLEGAKKLGVSVVERNPFALYCPSATRPDDASACFFLDNEGFIFDEAPAFSGTVYFVYAKDVPLQNPKGSLFMPKDEFQNLSQFVEAVERLGFEPLALELAEREVTILLPGEAKIVWEREADLTNIYSNIESFLNSKEIKEQPDFIEKLKLLDLRTRNKVFFRFKEQNDTGMTE